MKPNYRYPRFHAMAQQRLAYAVSLEYRKMVDDGFAEIIARAVQGNAPDADEAFPMPRLQ